MKKTLLTIAIISATLIGCNDTKNSEKTTDETSIKNVSRLNDQELTHVVDNSWINEIKLNDGKKWEANKETTEGVDKMLDLFENPDLKTTEDFHNLAAKLNELKNYLVKNCTMKGESHDNLHIFLHPLIEKIEALGTVTNTDEGYKISESIIENLKYYYTYFN